MIDTRQLRIGNFVLYKESKVKVSQIGLKHIHAFTFYREAKTPTSVENVPLLQEDLNPIILNEEMLLRCGFRKDTIIDGESLFVLRIPKYEDVDYLQELAFSSFCSDVTEYEVKLNVVPCSNETGKPVYSKLETQATCKPIIYLHQLQNLYFDLTGQELEVNL